MAASIHSPHPRAPNRICKWQWQAIPWPENSRRKVPLQLNRDCLVPSLHRGLCFKVGTIFCGRGGRQDEAYGQDQAWASRTCVYILNSANGCFVAHTLWCSLCHCANSITCHLPPVVTGSPSLGARLGVVQEPSNAPQRLRRIQIRGAGSVPWGSSHPGVYCGSKGPPHLGEERKPEWNQGPQFPSTPPSGTCQPGECWILCLL